MRTDKLTAIIILILLIFTSCSNNLKNTQDGKASTATPFILDTTYAVASTSTQELVEVTPAPYQNKAVPNTPVPEFHEATLSNGMTLKYIKQYTMHNEIKLIDKNANKEINIEGVGLNGEYVSKPVVSPDKCKFVYLAPFEWEIMSEIYIYDTTVNSVKKLMSLEQISQNRNVSFQYTPKAVEWLDNRYLLVLMQYGYGTELDSGVVYVLDTINNELLPLIKNFSDEYVSDMKADGKYLYVTKMRHEDKQSDKYKEIKFIAKYESIYDTIRSGKALIDLMYLSDSDYLEKQYQIKKDSGTFDFDIKSSFKEVQADLDGDNEPEVIRLQKKSTWEYVLWVNGQTLYGTGDNLDDNIYIVDIDTADGKKEIAVQEFGPSSDEFTTFYTLDNDKIIRMGKLGGLSVSEKLINGDGSVFARDRVTFMQTWFHMRQYKPDQEHKLSIQRQEYYPNSWKKIIKVKQELTLYKSPYNSPSDKQISTVVKPGEEVELLGSDMYRWCIVRTNSGVTGWFSVDGYSIVT